jgi:hypothetical protein
MDHSKTGLVLPPRLVYQGTHTLLEEAEHPLTSPAAFRGETRTDDRGGRGLIEVGSESASSGKGGITSPTPTRRQADRKSKSVARAGIMADTRTGSAAGSSGQRNRQGNEPREGGEKEGREEERGEERHQQTKARGSGTGGEELPGAVLCVEWRLQHVFWMQSFADRWGLLFLQGLGMGVDQSGTFEGRWRGASSRGRRRGR